MQRRDDLRLLQQVLDTIPVRVFWKDRDGRYLGCNALLAHDAGLEEPAQIIGRDDFQLAWRDQAERYRADDVAVIASGQAKLGYEEPQTTPSGDTIWLRTSKVPLRDEQGAVIGVLGTYEDITASKRAEQQRHELELRVLQAQKLESLGLLAGGIAHDFNNLLVGILGHADLALRAMGTASPGRDNVARIHTAATRASELTNQMLAYSGKGRAVVRALQLNELVTELSSLLEAAIPKSVVLRYRLTPDLPPVEADVAQLQQVVLNLLTNAAEAVRDKGALITVSTGLRDRPAGGALSGIEPRRSVFLSVSDDGCGIAAEDRARIFEPFFSTKFPGRGLGLAAVQGIVRGHQGAIEVSSELGVGSCFTVLLPEAPPGPSPRAQTNPLPGPPWRGTGLVLLVDDEPLVREVAAEMLAGFGLTVLCARDGVEALALLDERGEELDLVVLDLTMPLLDGMQTYQALRERLPGLPVILASGFDERDTVNRVVGRGLAGFLQKPFTVEQLGALVRRALERPR